jgi:hypothetical protein
MHDFDLDRYLRASKRLDLEGIRWDQISRYPLGDAERRCLTYMMDIESHTAMYLRDLLATRAAAEPEVTAFLSCWVYEELWHGEALSRFLGGSGHRLTPDDDLPTAESPMPTRVARNARTRRAVGGRGVLSHLGTMLGSALVPEFVALHMTWGALNELSTLTGYRLLSERSQHPILIELLSLIIKDERRHFAFYRAQARQRLERSASARRVTRWGMERLWAPVGTGVRPQAETDFVISWLLTGEEGRATAAEMDARIAELPGLSGIPLVQRARLKALRRSAAAARAG